MRFHKIILACVSCFLAGALYSQNPQQQVNDPQPNRFSYKRLSKDKNSDFYSPNFKWPKDNVEERLKFDLNRLKDPKTGKIPADIKKKELQYVRSAQSRLQAPPQERIGNIKTAPGDQSSAWVNRGPYNVGGRTRALAIDLDDENIILAGGVSGGMWRSTNQGTTWTRVTNGSDHPTVTDVEQDPRVASHDTWYYSTGERIGASQSARNGAAFLQGNGIYKSTDNGLTWTVLAATANPSPQTFNNPFDLIFGIEVNPVNGHLYVATFDGIFRSIDGGTSFQEVLPAEFDNFSDIHITSTGVIYAALDNGGGNGGVYRTTDGGSGTWIEITAPTFPATFGRTVIHTAPSNENILYVLASGTSTAPVGHDFWKYTYVSGDGTGAGGTWVNRSANLPAIGGSVGNFNSQGGYDLYVRVKPDDPEMVFIGGTNIYRSDNAFSTSSGVWIGGYSPNNNVSLYANHHPDQHSFEFFPSNTDKVITGHDGGISITTDITTSVGIEPVSWTSLNNGYLTTQVYALSIGPTNQLMAGFQDNSTWFTNNTTVTNPWVDLFSGDGSYNAFNDDGTLRYVSAQEGYLVRFAYPDANSSTATSGSVISPAGGIFVAPFEMDPNDDELMYYAAFNELYRNGDLPIATTTFGWSVIATTAGNISAIGISTNPANIVYIGTTSGEVYRINNAHTGTPAAVDVFTGKGMPGGNVASVDVNPNDPNDIIIAFSNYSIRSVFRTTDGGATWVNTSGNIEQNADGSGSGPSVRWAARVGDNDRFFIGTSTGLYSTTTLNGISTIWSQENLGGITNTVVEQIRVRHSDGLVAIGTHGNGIYTGSFEVSLPAVTVVNPIADVSVEANAPNTVINISNVFGSTEVPPLAITVTVNDNNNPSLLTTSISGNNLTLDYQLNQFGQATIMLKGTDTNGAVAFTSLTVNVAPPPISSFPLFVDFEAGTPDYWTTSGAMPWLTNSGPTPSANTGPVADHTIGDATGQYLYAETSGPATGAQAIFLSRKIDLSSLGNPKLEFWYHMFGATVGSLKVEVVDITNSTVTQVFIRTGAQQTARTDAYLNSSYINLTPFGSSIIQLRFTAVRGTSFTGDIAIDDIRVFDLLADDIGVSDLTVTNNPVFSTNEHVEIEITNFGSNSQAGFDVSYQINGGSVITENYAATLLPGTTANYTFTQTENLSAATTFNVTAFTELAGDQNSTNDAFSDTFTRVPLVSTFPYTESFESGAGSWIANGVANSWELGTPAKTTINSASSGTKAWITDLTGPYSNNEASQVTGPYFNFTNLTNPLIAFDIWGLSEADFDGAVLQYTLDNGSTWITVGNAGDPDNWYSNANISQLFSDFGNGKGWDVTTPTGWRTAVHPLNTLGGNSPVGLRIAFRADGSVTDEGFAFDNIRIVNLVAPTTVQATNVQNTSFDITWSAVPGITSYIVDASSDNFNSFLAGFNAKQVTGTSTSVTGLTSGGTYQFRVRAREASYQSANQSSSVLVAPAPSTTAASVITATSFTANWNSVAGATGYKIDVSKDNFATTLPGFSLAAVAGTNISVTGLTPLTVYKYRVKATFGGGDSPYSNIEQVTTLDAIPVAPSTLAASVAGLSVSLSWTDLSTNETSFVIERKTNAGAFVEIHTTTANVVSYVDNAVGVNNTYTYRVAARNGIGTSVFTTAVEINTNLPANPSALGGSQSGGTINLSWTDNSDNETGFKIERKEGSGNFIELAVAPVDAVSFSDNNVNSGITYTYQVAAVNAIGISGFSNAAPVSVVDFIPNAPTALSAIQTDAGVNLAWADNSLNETGFVVERKTGSGTYTAITTTAANTVAFTNTGTSPNTTYTYRVAAVGSAGTSAYSNEQAIITPPGAPVATNPTSIGDNAFTANWTVTDGSTTFLLDVSQNNFTSTLPAYTGLQVTGTSSLVSGLTESTTYKYRVRAKNTSGNSEYSNAMEIATLATIPVAPSVLSATINDNNDIELAWTDNSANETGFILERKTSDGSFTEIRRTAADVESFTDTEAQSQTTLLYRVAATNSRGNSTYSNEISILIIGIEDETLSGKVNVTPNPSRQLFNVEVKDATLNQINIKIFNAKGQLIQRTVSGKSTSGFQSKVDLGNQDAGVYMLLIETEDGRMASRRLVKY